MLRKYLIIAFILNCFFVFSQKKNVNVDSLINISEFQVFKDVKYGPDKKRNSLDIWLANSKVKDPFINLYSWWRFCRRE